MLFVLLYSAIIHNLWRLGALHFYIQCNKITNICSAQIKTYQIYLSPKFACPIKTQNNSLFQFITLMHNV
jgi:hypothetical protein